MMMMIIEFNIYILIILIINYFIFLKNKKKIKKLEKEELNK